MKDGLYRVTTNYLCAGFIIKESKIIEVAPILKKRFSYYLTIAKRVGD